MAEPVQIQIHLRNGLWALIRDGREVRQYGHVDEATHDAVRMAQDLIHTGAPAEVRVEAVDGKVIAVDLSEPERVGRPAGEEAAAVVPDRGPSA